MTTDAATVNDEIMQAVGHVTVPMAFLRTVASRGDAVALRWRVGDGWEQWTWTEYAEHVARAAAALRDLGLGRGDRIVLMLRNIAEFHVFDLAAAFCGATSVSIYNSSSPDQIRYLVNHCEATRGHRRGRRVPRPLPRGARRPDHVAHPGGARRPLGGGPGRRDLRPRRCWPPSLSIWPRLVDEAQPDDLATLIYTSGTTGPPKAVMITHRNIAWTVESLARCIQLRDLRRHEAGVVPADGPHRRAHDQPLPDGRSSATTSPAARIPDRPRPISVTSGPTSSSGCPGYGRRCTRA